MSLMRAACGVFLLTYAVLSSRDASASGYKVSYAIDAGDTNDAGTVTCDYKSDCKITSTKLKLSFTISGRVPVYQSGMTVEISDDAGRWNCCYFEDGMTKVARDTTESLLRFGIYVGRRQGHLRRTGEYLINEPLGILYLQFLDEQ
jgi:hypothetical protein